MTKETNNQNVLVTGGSSGIGRSIVIRLAREGYRVITCARQMHRLAELKRDLLDEGFEIFTIKADLKEENSILKMFEEIRNGFGGVEVLINCAGIGHNAPLLTSPSEPWRETIDVNIIALSICTREAVRMMRRIADHIEENLGLDRGWVRAEEQESAYSTQLAVAQSVCQTAERLGAHCIVAQTISGTTARLISMYRPTTPVVAITPKESTYHHLSMVWGIEALLIPKFEKDFLRSTAAGDKVLMERGYAKKGDLVVVSAGIPAAKSGGTNIMKLHSVGLD